MNKELFDSMQKQMAPGPEVRAALSEKLSQPAKRRIPIRKYVAVAACAALVIGGFSAYRLYRDEARWALITQSYQRGGEIRHLHTYVIVEDSPTTDTGALVAENGVEDTYYTGHIYTRPIDRDSGAPNTGDLSSPEGSIEDVLVQEGAEDYQMLMAHFNGVLPDWYGGGYLDGDGRLVVLLVESKDPGDKSLELQVQEWTGSDRVRFGSAKYSLNHLKELMDRLNRLPDADLKYSDVMAGWGIDEENNRIELTLTQVYEPLLSVLAELDPDDDAIYVQVGQRAAAYAGEDLTVVTPDGTVSSAIWVDGMDDLTEDDENLIADEPWVGDIALVEHLPEQKQPAVVQSVPEEEELDPLTAVTYDVETGEITVHPHPYSKGSKEAVSRSTAPFNPGT